MVKVLERPRAGRCPLCGMEQALVKEVVYYKTWHVSVCRICGLVVQRHTNWLREARTRYLQNRAVVRGRASLPTALIEERA